MAAGFKAADSFHVKPVFTTQQHTQPDALWYQHPLLPLQEVAFDSWTAGLGYGVETPTYFLQKANSEIFSSCPHPEATGVLKLLLS